jgi:hypothetical protein
VRNIPGGNTKGAFFATFCKNMRASEFIKYAVLFTGYKNDGDFQNG